MFRRTISGVFCARTLNLKYKPVAALRRPAPQSLPNSCSQIFQQRTKATRFPVSVAIEEEFIQLIIDRSVECGFWCYGPSSKKCDLLPRRPPSPRHTTHATQHHQPSNSYNHRNSCSSSSTHQIQKMFVKHLETFGVIKSTCYQVVIKLLSSAGHNSR